ALSQPIAGPDVPRLADRLAAYAALRRKIAPVYGHGDALDFGCITAMRSTHASMMTIVPGGTSSSGPPERPSERPQGRAASGDEDGLDRVALTLAHDAEALLDVLQREAVR